MTIYVHSLPEILFLLFWFIKPFYILPSGYPQIGDFLLILSFILWMVYNKKIYIKNDDKLFLLFVVCVIVINTTYAIIYKNIMFFVPCSYFVFNLICVILFSCFSQNKNFLCTLRKITRIMLIIQLLVYFSGLGRWYAEARYMGTFNDPNQLGFFILTSFFIIKLIDHITFEKNKIYDDVIAIFLIYVTSSTGMFLGIAIYYFIIYILLFVKNKLSKRQIYIFIVLFLCGFLCALITYLYIEDLKYYFRDELLIQRILEKIEKLFTVSSSGKSSILDDRNLDKLFLYPSTALYGAGEAMLERFTLAKNAGELHSVPFALLFYYGIVPFMFVTLWTINKVRKTHMYAWPIVGSIIIESITLVNYRQPAFWIIFLLSSLTIKGENKHDAV